MTVVPIKIAVTPNSEPMRVLVLNQLLLPEKEEWVSITSPAVATEAIRTMVVRGAPLIGIVAAFGLASTKDPESPIKWEGACERLSFSRPTAVNLFWAIDKMTAERAHFLKHQEDLSKLFESAVTILQQDVASCRAIGDNIFKEDLGSKPLRVLTHCNAGALATGGYGTALGVVRSLHSKGRIERVYADETRPYLQGARLTAWELEKEGIPVSIIPDVAAAHFMATGLIDMVVVGADRISMDGAAANKIGTLQIAIAAHRYGIPFYVAAPTSTLDKNTAEGKNITIEFREGNEGKLRAPEAVPYLYPAFDVTPPDLISKIITEKGCWLPRDINQAVS